MLMGQFDLRFLRPYMRLKLSGRFEVIDDSSFIDHRRMLKSITCRLFLMHHHDVELNCNFRFQERKRTPFLINETLSYSCLNSNYVVFCDQEDADNSEQC
ncbi:hypothetical protein L6452_13509 [Arctium lappa]|uniref:Uncharacterized protein n=1 Tax=Arctium lappa TaxID=4217 RepID=A0ACB9CIB5_ARCLA|nr:hypothetical protein L6452_13509 [Arctium lappa]